MGVDIESVLSSLNLKQAVYRSNYRITALNTQR